MPTPKLIAERRFGDVRAMLGDIQTMLTIANMKWTETCYVKLFEPDSGYASIARLFQDTLTDGSKVYELHIL